MDYTGIIVLVLGDFVSGIYVGFYCEPMLQNTYWTMICTRNANSASFDMPENQADVGCVRSVPSVR